MRTPVLLLALAIPMSILSPSPVPAQTCTPAWDTAIGDPGMNNRVLSFGVYDEGSGPRLFGAGLFTTAGGVTANRIARWNVSAWSALGTGLNSQTLSLGVFDDGSGSALYAGGGFLTAGGVSASRVARWNGTSWSALGAGLNNNVEAFAVFDDGSGPAIYAGGHFTMSGATSMNYVARWTGSAWAPLGTGMDNPVLALEVFDDGTGPALYAGGLFTMAGGAAASRIAKWNGSAWSAVGGGTSSTVVNAMKAWNYGAGPALFVGGAFTSVGGSVTASNIAKWNGSAWSALGTGTNGSVQALELFNEGSGTQLYVGGLFSTAGGVSASHVARWDGSAWSALGGAFSSGSGVYALKGHDDGTVPALYVGGLFSTLNGQTANNIVRWTGCASDTPALSARGGAVLALLFVAGGVALLRSRRRAISRS